MTTTAAALWSSRPKRRRLFTAETQASQRSQRPSPRSPRLCREYSSVLHRRDRVERPAFALVLAFEVGADGLAFTGRAGADVVDDREPFRGPHDGLDVFLPVSLVVRDDLQSPAWNQD